MSLHPVRTPTRDEIVRAYDSRPTPASLGMAMLALAAIGIVTFIAGLFVDPDRAWRAYHVSWLYVTSLSSAGVMFVAVQRITTARWSRPIIRFMEGYVAFLPVAFVLLLLSVFLGKHHGKVVDVRVLMPAHQIQDECFCLRTGPVPRLPALRTGLPCDESAHTSSSVLPDPLIQGLSTLLHDA